MLDGDWSSDVCSSDLAEYLKKKLQEKGARMVFAGPTFNEFVVEFDEDFGVVRQRLLAKDIVAGLDLAHFYPELAGKYLFCVTETVKKEILDVVIEEVEK
jgi:glycine dehydrogenase subunit 1